MSCGRAGILNTAMLFVFTRIHPPVKKIRRTTQWCSQLPPGVEAAAMIAQASAESLGLQEGKEAYAVVKASNVMVAID
jgi:molybdopterin-binding protein